MKKARVFILNLLALMSLALLLYLVILYSTFDLANQSNYFRLAFALLGTSAFAATEIYVTKGRNIERFWTAGLFLALAMFSWAVVAVCRIYGFHGFLESLNNIHDKDGEMLFSWFSTLNSALILAGFAHLEVEKNRWGWPWKWIQEPSGQEKTSGIPKKLFFSCLAAIAILIMLIDFIVKPYTIDTWFSFTTSLILGYGLFLVYWQRDLKTFSLLALVMSFSIVIGHLQYFSFYDEFPQILKSGFDIKEVSGIYIQVYKITLMMLLFTISITNEYDRWKKEKGLAEVQAKFAEEEAERANKEAERANKSEKELNALNKYYRGFIEHISAKLLSNTSSTRAALDFTYKYILASNARIYGFGLALKSENEDSIIFQHRYINDDEPLSNHYKPFNINIPFREEIDISDGTNTPKEPYISRCIRRGKQEDISFFEEEKGAFYSLHENKDPFPKAVSFWVYPLKEIGGKTFGVIGIYSRERNIKEQLGEEGRETIKTLAVFLSNTLSKEPSKSLLREFVHQIRKIPNKDIHLNKNGIYNDSIPTHYRELEIFTGLNLHTAFEIKQGQYRDAHPINSTLKGINRSQLSLGIVLLVAIAAFEHNRNYLNDRTSTNPFLAEWIRKCKEWEWENFVNSENSDSAPKNYQKIYRDSKFIYHSKNYLDIISSIYDLFSNIVVYRLEKKSYIQSVQLRDNELIIELDVMKKTKRFMDEFRQEEDEFRKNGEDGISGNVTRELILLMNFLKQNFDVTETKGKSTSIDLNFFYN